MRHRTLSLRLGALSIPLLFLLFGSQAIASAFPESYDAARERFRELARKIAVETDGAELGYLPVPSQVDDDLTIDYLYLPATEKSEKIFILTSGIHGVEAYAGSAVQFLFLEEQLAGIDRREMGVLVVHALNPFGYKYGRRVSENNVDLNRNFDVSPELFETANETYAALDDFLNPERRVSFFDLVGWFKQLKEFAKAYLSLPTEVLRQAILQGQYTHPKGLYFGGFDFEPQKELLDDLFARMVAPYRYTFLVDIHTGYGERGVLHYYGNSTLTPAAQKAQDVIFAGFPIDSGNEDDFYTTKGDLALYFSKVFEDKVGLSMTFEYGTLDSQTLRGSIESLLRTKLENQGYHWGYRSAYEERTIKSSFLEMYYPSDAVWRDKVLKQARGAFPVVLERFRTYEAE